MADIVPISLEQADLRRAVRQIADKYGHRYFVECATSHKEPTELYGELGAGGFLGVHLPEEYGGGGAGLGELTAVIEEVSAAGCPLLTMVIAPAICGSIIAAHGSTELKRAWVPQHRFLGGGGEQPVPGHANTLSNTADNSGEVKRRFLPRLQAGASTPRS